MTTAGFTYAKMLEEEIAASEKFTKENFGLRLGDGYPEMARELAASKRASMKLVANITRIILNLDEVGASIAALPSPDYGRDGGDQTPDLSLVILDNQGAFEPMLSMFYWGIQVGRRMEREQAAALKAMDGEQRGTAL